MATQPSPTRLTRPDDEGAVVIASRCSFETVQAFQASEVELRERQNESAARDIRRKSTKFEPPPPSSSLSTTPAFITSVKSPSQFSLKTEAARRNDHAKTPYKPPSDFVHRMESPPSRWKRAGEDFVAKFRLSSNQDLRSRAALDQEGFFSVGDDRAGVAATQLIASDHPDAHRKSQSPTRLATSPTARAEFQTSVPHTTRKSSNIALRAETIVDQDGLLPQLREIRDHKYRDDGPSPTRSASSSPSAATVTTEPFRAAFKPAPSLRPIGGGVI